MSDGERINLHGKPRISVKADDRKGVLVCMAWHETDLAYWGETKGRWIGGDQIIVRDPAAFADELERAARELRAITPAQAAS
jgi:predicted TIM-barrel fold metal-dependent hydrolase